MLPFVPFNGQIKKDFVIQPLYFNFMKHG